MMAVCLPSDDLPFFGVLILINWNPVKRESARAFRESLFSKNRGDGRSKGSTIRIAI
jgi:hypothetical protein